MTNPNESNTINLLIGRFASLQEQWEGAPANFDWTQLERLAHDGAHAYNEGAGPSFHALAFDGTQHTEFHERFLAFSVHGGFDPFKVVSAGTGSTELPVIDHAGLAEAAQWNASSARMHGSLMDIARARFTTLANEMENNRETDRDSASQEQLRVVFATSESIPSDLLLHIAPELVSSSQERPRRQQVDPIEGYLSNAELMVDNLSKPYG